MFGRIHVDDIAAGLEASIAAPRAGGVYNLTDDEPAPSTAAIIRAMSCGRDRRWSPSPSLIRVKTTSALFRPVGQLQGVGPGHVGVLAALQHADRDLDRHGAGQDRPAGAVLEQVRVIG
jgi:hypothetical protein